MKLVSKIKSGIASAMVAGSMAMTEALNVFAAPDDQAQAAPDLSSVTSGISTAVKSVVDVVSTIAYILVALVFVILGITLIWGGDKAKEKVKAHLVTIIIGTVIVALAATLAKWWISSIGGNTTGMF